jgi:hypothetical protein
MAEPTSRDEELYYLISKLDREIDEALQLGYPDDSTHLRDLQQRREQHYKCLSWVSSRGPDEVEDLDD